MTGQPVLLCNGKRLLVGARIGRGGEGEVRALDDGSNRAIKIYHSPDREHEAKVGAMVAAQLGRLCPNVAFPQAEVRYGDGRFAGFTMDRVSGHEPIHELTGTGSRRQYFPDANWRFLVHVALNLAKIVTRVHQSDVVIGDINSAGFLVSGQGEVTLIDADSFQIRGHRCRVGMPDYTAPEIQGQHFGDIDRTKDHDAFGLSVMIFQILALGRHPFSGVLRGRALPIEMAIKQGRFAFSEMRRAGLDPPPNTLRLTDLPRGICLAFERAFALRIGARPTAAHWVGELSRLLAGLTPCTANANHHVTSATGLCPWCPIERATGKTLFLAGGTSSLPRAPYVETNLHREVGAAIAHAKHHAGDTLEPSWPRIAPAPSKAARKAHDQNRARPGWSPTLAPLIASVGTGRAFVDRHQAARIAALKALDTWKSSIGIWDVCRIVSGMADDLKALNRLYLDRPQLLAKARANWVAEKTTEMLRSHRLAIASIPGIGDRVRAHLINHGIITAANVTRAHLDALPGLGDARIFALLLWRETLALEAERAVLKSGRADTDMEARAHVARDKRVHQAETDLRARAEDLRQRVAKVLQRASLVDRNLHDAMCARDQAATDLAYLGIAAAVPAALAAKISPAPAARKAKAKPKTSGTKGKANPCPLCGAPMIKRWGSPAPGGSSMFRGCSTYPKCRGTRRIRKKKGSP